MTATAPIRVFCCNDNLSLERVSKASPPNFKVERSLNSATNSTIEDYPLSENISNQLQEIVPLKSFSRCNQTKSLEDAKQELILEYRFLQMQLQKIKLDPEKVQNLAPEKAKEIVNNISERINASCNFFKELKEIGYFRELSKSMYVRNVGAFVIDLPKKAHKEASKLYVFFPEFGLLFTKGAIPSPRDLLLTLCSHGKYPKSIRPIIDGSLYASQWKAPRRALLFSGEFAFAATLKFLSPWIDPILAVTRISLPFLRRIIQMPFNFFLKTIPIFRARHTLGEAQKEYFNIESPALYEEIELDRLDTAAKLLASRKWIHADKDELKKALNLIHQLRVLGMSHTEITGMIPWSKYNKDSKTYPKFEAKIKELRNKQGLDDDIIFNEFCRQSLELIDIREKISRAKVMLISRLALDNVASNNA